MAANSIGKAFTVTCFGESHGKCLGVVIDGCPAGLLLSEDDIQAELDKRVPPKLELTSGRVERDIVEILSGVFEGHTTGAPVCMIVLNKEAVSSEYNAIKDLPRPGHADYPAHVRYGGFNDYRGGGRFSGRITVSLVMAGAVAKKLLRIFGVEVYAYAKAIGKVKIDENVTLEQIRENTYKNPVRCPDLSCAEKMEQAIIEARSEGDSLGGIVECVALNVPAGVGDPVFDALDADIAKAIFAIPAVKGVEFGAGFSSATMRGSENNDAYAICGGKIVTLTNNAGGILGGISTGMPIVVRAAIKPTPSIPKKQKTIDLSKLDVAVLEVKGRHDPCIVPKAVSVIESTVAIVIADHMIRAGIIPRVLWRK
ncbi:MAG: chorismate synthase [Candidatus Bathyarchaeota archaeon]|nr:chorismate synthase [Candidatus Bathyarchaeota archaeon]MCX8176717.1 chorismate synthase [Candidatus Bathyarchaeota archaeon]MDW8193245.1 chorismate synthase [Nitrososphaerota archaeon]